MDLTEERKAAKIASQWPKKCGCGRVYDRRVNRADGVLLWRDLPFAYNYTDAYATQEARHCACGSTIVVNIAIHDLTME